MKVGDLVTLKRSVECALPTVEIGVVVRFGLGNRAYVSFPSAPEWRTYAKAALEVASGSR